MTKGSLSVQLIGAKEAIASLRQFSRGVRRKHMRIAMDAGGSILRAEASRRVTKETGTLKRNLAVKSGLSKDELKAWSRVGAKRNVRIAIANTARGKTRKIANFRRLKSGEVKIQRSKSFGSLAGKRMKYRLPSRIAHLVEGGTRKHVVAATSARVLSNGRSVFGRRVSVSARPKPFLEPTSRSRGPIASARAVRKLNEGIRIESQKALARANARAKKVAKAS